MDITLRLLTHKKVVKTTVGALEYLKRSKQDGFLLG
jgi:hypothetical protein